MTNLFGPIKQLGIVVHDMDAALRYWTENMGVGPFFVLNQLDLRELSYKGDPVELEGSLGRIALANSGQLQIELIQQLTPARTSYTEFLNAGNEGMHHVGYCVDLEDYDEYRRRGLEAGLVVEQEGVLFGPEGKFVYFSTTGHPGTVQEVIAMHDGNRDLFQMVADSAIDWDGADPIRNLN